MPYIPADAETFFIRHDGEQFPVIAWNLTHAHTCPVTAHPEPLGLHVGDAVRFPDGSVLDLHLGTIFPTFEEWESDAFYTDAKRGAPFNPAARAVAAKPGKRSGPKPVGPFGTVFAGKTYQRWSNWLLEGVPGGDVVMELPPNTKSPTNDFATRINRERAAEETAAGARKMSYEAVQGLESPEPAAQP